MAIAQRRSSATDPRRRHRARAAPLRPVGFDGERIDGASASPARAMQRQLAHRWDRGLDDDTFGPRYSPAARATLLLGSASLLWVTLVVAVRLALG